MNTAFKNKKTGKGGIYTPLLLGALFMAAAPFISLSSTNAGISASDAQCINPSPEIKADYRAEPSDIFFGYESASLRDDAKPVLAENAEILKRNPDLYVIIQGVSNINESGGKLLAESRAHNVRDFMISQGVESGRLLTSAMCNQNEQITSKSNLPALEQRVHFISVEMEELSNA